MIFMGIITAAFVLSAVYFTNFGISTITEPKEREIEGVVREVSETASLVSMRSSDGRNISLALVPQTEIFDETGRKIDIGGLRKGFVVRAEAEFTGLLAIPSIIRIIDSPRIIVYTPEPNQPVFAKIYLTGSALVFENNVEYRVKDANGEIFASGFTTADAKTGEYGEFQVAITYRAPKGKTGTLEVFETSAESGAEVNKVIIPIRFGELGG